MNSIWTDFVNFWENDVWAGLKKLFSTTISAEVQALTPIATQVISTIENDLKAATNLSQIGTIVGGAFSAVASQAEAAAVSAGASSLITVVSSALGGVLGTTAAASVGAPTPPAAS